ncbi:hypothetical protein [Hyphomonas pacifica]|uniref:Uncharacterized protein n=1 Tax=Hyphomonas pacifica TaxID=1280941 RepID=A0A8B2PN67_9PROT|nr:hypothetical protein [Hyphomonas pacifica]RAN32263.1 hypothetical protein HY3_02760 [Hyphomonas pacifica]RAN33849.1 hypothetical protein HY11_03910 [Hyphomonas pacifica]
MTTSPAYASPQTPRKIQRVKLGLLLSSLAACLMVSLLAIIIAFVLNTLGLLGDGLMLGSQQGFFNGLHFGLIMCLYNFVLFFITVPAAWIALGFSIGRMPHRRIAKRGPYMRWGAIWGTILVGGTTLVFGAMADGLMGGLGAAIIGCSIGAIAGALCGLLFYAIVKPADQLHDTDISVF